MEVAIMKLEKELKLKNRAMDINHEALLSVVLTASMLHKLAERFFVKFDVTDTQFNILMTLNDSGYEGLTQQELSEKLVVHKSNVTGLVDRLEKLGYVTRQVNAEDRRCNYIVLTAKGKKLIRKAEAPYFAEVDRIMNSLNDEEKKSLISSTGKLRQLITQRG